MDWTDISEVEPIRIYAFFRSTVSSFNLIAFLPDCRKKSEDRIGRKSEKSNRPFETIVDWNDFEWPETICSLSKQSVYIFWQLSRKASCSSLALTWESPPPPSLFLVSFSIENEPSAQTTQAFHTPERISLSIKDNAFRKPSQKKKMN